MADDAHAAGFERRAGLPGRQQVLDDRVELLLGRVPRLEQVVVERDLVDRGDRGLGVGVGGEQDALGVGDDLARLDEVLGARHARHPLVGDEQRDLVAARAQLAQDARAPRRRTARAGSGSARRTRAAGRARRRRARRARRRRRRSPGGARALRAWWPWPTSCQPARPGPRAPRWPPPRAGPGSGSATGAARCYTRAVPTSHPRHSITETPALAAALEPLRARLGADAPTLAELVMRGAESTLRELEAQDRVRARALDTFVDRLCDGAAARPRRDRPHPPREPPSVSARWCCSTPARSGG